MLRKATPMRQQPASMRVFADEGNSGECFNLFAPLERMRSVSSLETARTKGILGLMWAVLENLGKESTPNRGKIGCRGV
jgi:hypothetical protein